MFWVGKTFKQTIMLELGISIITGIIGNYIYDLIRKKKDKKDKKERDDNDN